MNMRNTTLNIVATFIALAWAVGPVMGGAEGAPAGNGPSADDPQIVNDKALVEIKESWIDKAISPVTNPLFFESPFVQNEIRPIFMYHNIDDSFVTRGGDVQVYALQFRWAITDRLALIATKDGYIDFNPESGLTDQEGFADIAAGLKYALIQNEENQFILTPGFVLELPTGNQDVFQGDSSGEWNLFCSAAKGWGDFHVVGNVGFRIPNDWGDKTAQAHYSLQLDYYTCQWFIPYVALNGFTVMSRGNKIGLDTEGYDLINFGSSAAEGRTSLVLGWGFRSRVHERVDIGFGYEHALTTPKGLFDDRFTVDTIIRF